MNSLYYDLTTGDIIDYHGGLYCLREGFMDTAVEGNLALSTNPMIIRLLRFKARYGFRLSDSLEAAMRNNALDYARKIEPLEVENQLRRMWFGGYAADCFDVLIGLRPLWILPPSCGGHLSHRGIPGLCP